MLTSVSNKCIVINVKNFFWLPGIEQGIVKLRICNFALFFLADKNCY